MKLKILAFIAIVAMSVSGPANAAKYYEAGENELAVRFQIGASL